MRSYHLNVQGRAGAVALGIAVVILGIVVIVSGIALLIGVALIAVIVAAGAVLLRKVFGQRTPPPVRRTSAPGFDPALEVFPPEVTEGRRRLPQPVRLSKDERDGQMTGEGG